MQHKRKLLDHWLRDTTINQAIVFASTQVECDGLANDLQQDGFSAVALHGALSQGLRNRRLMALRQGQVQILVATDVAARGIDVPTITHVFNYGLPMKAEDYTHRIGRTGRAGRDGLAITFAEQRDRRRIFDIEGYSAPAVQGRSHPRPRAAAACAAIASPQGDFRGRDSRDSHSRDRKFGGGGGGHRGGNGGGFGGGGSNYAGASGFNDRNARGPGAGAPRGFQNAGNAGFGGGRDEGGGGYGRKPGWGDSAPRGGGFGGGGAGRGEALGRAAMPAAVAARCSCRATRRSRAGSSRAR